MKDLLRETVLPVATDEARLSWELLGSGRREVDTDLVIDGPASTTVSSTKFIRLSLHKRFEFRYYHPRHRHQ